MYKMLTIKNGFFYGAGAIYGWKKDGYHQHGVGIARKYFDQPTLRIKVDGDTYTVDMEEALKFVRQYKAHRTIKGTKVGFISRDLLQRGKIDKEFMEDVKWFDNLPRC